MTDGRLEPKSFGGISFNVIDQEKFRNALVLLQESTGNLPIFVADNTITWNRNLSFLREDFYIDFLRSDKWTDVEKSCVWRLYILIYFAEQCKTIDGDYMEIGCHKGTTAMQVIEKIDFIGLEKEYWLYDLFKWEAGDLHTKMDEHSNPKMHEQVVERFSGRTYVNIIQGLVPDSFTEGIPDKIAFAHIDMNNAKAEAGALNKVLPRLSIGGCIVFDDYGWWGYSEQKIALDKIVEINLKILELPTGQGVLIKSN